MKIYTEDMAEALLSKHLPVANNKLLSPFADPMEYVRSLSMPIVFKLISKDALHKSDIGGVQIVHRQSDVHFAWKQLLAQSKKHKLKLNGILVQEYIVGRELYIGIKKDPIFGHVIIFGIGGVLVEVINDVSLRVCPITESDAKEMINEIKSKCILGSFRGAKPIQKSLLQKVLVKVSKLPLLYPKLEELDINPFIINHSIGKVVDARIVM